MQQLNGLDLASSPTLEITFSVGFNNWLDRQNFSIAFTTYQAGKIFFVGLQPSGKLSIFERTFDRSMGLWVQDSTLYLSSLYQVWRFENALQPGEIHHGYDALYVPQCSYVTGDLDIHDLVVDKANKLVFANTLFNCLATVSNHYSFVPLWQPPFITDLVAEDRCHLNGIALREGEVRYVTAIGQTNSANGWRDLRDRGGCVVDVTTNEVIATDLSMPHSPRWYQDRLWLLNSGTGEFGYIDRQGTFEPIVFCPGYLRGCAFKNNYALLGLSLPRNRTFSNLMLDEKLKQTNTEAICGLVVIDLKTGEIVHWLRLNGVVKELYDVSIIPKVKRPMAIGFKSDEIRKLITIGRSYYS